MYQRAHSPSNHHPNVVQQPKKKPFVLPRSKATNSNSSKDSLHNEASLSKTNHGDWGNGLAMYNIYKKDKDNNITLVHTYTHRYVYLQLKNKKWEPTEETVVSRYYNTEKKLISESYKLASSRRVVGKIDRLGQGGEKHGSDNEPKTEMAKAEIEYFLGNYPFEYQARSIFLNVNTFAASGGSNPKVGKDLMRSVRRFLKKGGGTFLDYKNAEDEFRKSHHYTDLKKELNSNFQDAIQANKGSIESLQVKVPEPPDLSDLSEQMLALFGGTQYMELDLNHWKLEKGNTYSGRIIVNIFDTYGVSEKDIKKHDYLAELAGAMKGLIAMWVLQNKYNYVPLINGLQIIIPISGIAKK